MSSSSDPRLRGDDEAAGGVALQAQCERLGTIRHPRPPDDLAVAGVSRRRVSYSHGLEWVVETGKVKDAATLGDWIEDVLVHGAGRTDAIFLAEAWRAVAAGDAAVAARGRRAGRGLRRPRPSAGWKRWRRAPPS